MTKRIYLFLFTVVLMSTFNKVNAQSESFKSPVITDEMTVNPDQNKEWRTEPAKQNSLNQQSLTSL